MPAAPVLHELRRHARVYHTTAKPEACAPARTKYLASRLSNSLDPRLPAVLRHTFGRRDFAQDIQSQLTFKTMSEKGLSENTEGSITMVCWLRAACGPAPSSRS